MLLLPSRSRSRLKNTDTPSQGGAWQYALKLLAMRDYTLARLKAKLSSRDYDETDIEAALGRLEAEGWINDRRFAERFAESAVCSGRFYGLRLRHEMLRRGFPTAIVDEVLRQVGGEYDADEQIHALLVRRFSGFSYSSSTDKERRRVMGFLQRRGFGISATIRAMKTFRDD
jgi:regulatory protein